jgi:hypothetical protein
MQDDTASNEHDSDTTPPKPPHAVPSEAEYLTREALDARKAISHTLDQMRASLKDAGDVKAWARTYPWTTVGAAAAAGFLVASALVPKRGRPAKQDAALLERILTDEQIADRLRTLAAEDDGKASGEGVVHTFVSTLLKTFGPAVQSAIAAALAAKATQQPPPESSSETSTNGAAPPESSDGPAQPPVE